MEEVVIVSGCRTAIGAFGGTLKDFNGATIASVTMREAVKRAGLDPSVVDDVRYGCCMEHHDTLNVTRVGALLAGIPDSIPAVTFWGSMVSKIMVSVRGGPSSIQLRSSTPKSKILIRLSPSQSRAGGPFSD